MPYFIKRLSLKCKKVDLIYKVKHFAKNWLLTSTMSLFHCANPFNLKAHENTDPSLLCFIEEQFCIEYKIKFPQLTSGMRMYLNCIQKIKSSSDIKVNCVDPLSTGHHECANYSIVSQETQKQFYLNKDDLPVGSALCGVCRVKLLKKQCQFEKSNRFHPIPSTPIACCNPFDNIFHSHLKVALRVITQEMAQKYQNVVSLRVGEKLCSKCRTALYDKSREAEAKHISRERSRSR